MLGSANWDGAPPTENWTSKTGKRETNRQNWFAGISNSIALGMLRPLEV